MDDILEAIRTALIYFFCALFYLFIMALTIFTIWYSEPTVVSTNPTVIRFELYFLVINGIAVATLILYAPYQFIFYLRKTKSGPEVRRDTSLIIIGITGFALSELLFEILFPNYGIDLRAPGFIMEMALIGLIAFGVRGESFLQALIVPEADLRYFDWVEANRRKVEQATGGRAGYIHLPDMQARGLQEFIRQYYPQVRKELRARYPRHAWPEDPLAAPPERRPQRRRNG